MEKIRPFLVSVFMLILSINSKAQTASTTVYYGGFQACGGCTVCGADYWCTNTLGSYCGNTPSCDTKYFTDPVPAGKIVTSVTANLWTASCDGSSINVSINGYNLPTAYDGNGGCLCDNNPCMMTTSTSQTYPCGLPGYVYGGSNTLQLCSGTDMCINRLELVFTYVNPDVINPVINASGPTTFCSGGSVTLDVGAGYPAYHWNTGATTQAINVNTSGTYSVTVTSTTGCTTGSASQVVTVNPNPTVSVSASPTTICSGASSTLTASGASTYSWSNGLGTGNPKTVSPSSSTTYYVTGTNTYGCTNTSNVTVNVNPTPSASATNTGPYCSGSTIQLNLATTGTSYSWSGPGGWTSTAQNPTISNATTAMGGTYTVTVTGIGGCTNTASTNVTINPTPTATASNIGPYCEGSTIQLNLTTTGTSYSWSGPGGWTSTSQNPTISNATTAMAGSYSVTVTGAGGCTNTASTSILVNTNPTASAMNTGPYCEGATLQLMLATTGTSYNWSGPGGWTSTAQNPTRPSLTASMGGTYTVTVTGTGGCTTTATTDVTVYPTPTVNVSNTGPYCIGETIQLNLTTTGTSYSWNGPNGFTSNQQNPSLNNANQTMTGIYSVTVTGTGGCTNSSNTNVVVNALPTITVSSNSPVCDQGILTLSATGGISYQWDGPNGFTDNTSSPTISPVSGSNAGTYNVTVTDNNNCSSVGQTSVIVNALPELTVTSNSPLCSGQDLELTSSNALSWSWSGPDSWTSNTQNPVIVNAQTNNSGTYYVTITDNNGCTNTNSLVVTVNQSPLADAGINDTIPYGTNTTLHGSASLGSGDYSYTWQPSDSLINPNIQNPTTVNLEASTVFILNVIDNVTGCQDTSQVSVIVVGGPLMINLSSNPSSICLNDSSQITALVSGGTGTYTYSWSSNPTGFTSNIQNPVVYPTVTTTYTLTIFDGFNSIQDSITIIVNSLPNVYAGQVTSICSQSSITLSGTGALNYLWSNGIQDGVPFVPQATNSYTVTGTDANGCSNTDSVTIVVNPLPTVQANASQTIVCQGNQVTLYGSGTATNYIWSDGVVDNQAFVPSTSQTYYVTGTDANNCYLTDSIQITVTPTYVFNENYSLCNGGIFEWHQHQYTNSGIYYDSLLTVHGCDSIYILNLTLTPPPPVTIQATQTTVCFGSSTTLTASGASSYSWNTGDTSAVIVVSPTTNTTYTLIGTTNGCSDTTSIDISVNPLPAVTISSNISSLCDGENATLTASGANNYIWSTGQTGEIININPTATTTYVVTGTDANNCSNTSSINIIVNPDYNISQSASICEGEVYLWGGNSYNQSGTYTLNLQSIHGCDSILTLNLSVNPKPQLAISGDTLIIIGSSGSLLASGADNYTWLQNEGLSCLDCPNPIITPESTTNYCVIGSTIHNCSDTVCITVAVDSDCGELFFPLSLTPNGDGKNDVWMVRGRCIKSLELSIYDRWGEKVFETNNKNDLWDGTYRGKPLDTDVYVFVATIKMIDGTEKKIKGDITLLR